MIRVPLRAKKDRRGNTYLFAALPMFDHVLFVYPRDKPDQHGNDYELVVKPHRAAGAGTPRSGDPVSNGLDVEGDDFSAAWDGRSAKPPVPRAA